MSDLVGNPEDRFSRVVAHKNLNFHETIYTKEYCVKSAHTRVYIEK